MRNSISALQTLGAAICVNGAFVPVALAAWEPGPEDWEMLLTGSLALLAVGLVLKLVDRRRKAEPAPIARVNTGSRFFGPQFFPNLDNDVSAARNN